MQGRLMLRLLSFSSSFILGLYVKVVLGERWRPVGLHFNNTPTFKYGISDQLLRCIAEARIVTK